MYFVKEMRTDPFHIGRKREKFKEKNTGNTHDLHGQ